MEVKNNNLKIKWRREKYLRKTARELTAIRKRNAVFYFLKRRARTETEYALPASQQIALSAPNVVS